MEVLKAIRKLLFWSRDQRVREALFLSQAQAWAIRRAPYVVRVPREGRA